MTTYNLNSKVRVKLTNAGRNALKRDHDIFWASVGRTMPYTPTKEDAEGWSEWQLWNIMEKLGSYFHLGYVNVMDTTIQLEPFDAPPGA